MYPLEHRGVYKRRAEDHVRLNISMLRVSIFLATLVILTKQVGCQAEESALRFDNPCIR